jgi:hypothetical protein
MGDSEDDRAYAVLEGDARERLVIVRVLAPRFKGALQMTPAREKPGSPTSPSAPGRGQEP